MTHKAGSSRLEVTRVHLEILDAEEGQVVKSRNTVAWRVRDVVECQGSGVWESEEAHPQDAGSIYIVEWS